MESFDGQHAFITGGASGIGLGIADALLKRGATVTIADIDAESIEAVTASRHNIFGVVLDVRDYAAIQAAKAEAETARGKIDILVANAAIGPDGVEIADIKPESFARTMAINVGGIFNTISVFAADMRARRSGRILITGSMAGLATGQVPGVGVYSASKSAVVSLGESLRTEMASYGVGVSVMCPGMVATNLGRTTKKLGGEMKRINMEGAVIAAVMQPEVAGEIAVSGLEQNKAFIITHPGDWPSVERRCRDLEAAFLGS